MPAGTTAVVVLVVAAVVVGVARTGLSLTTRAQSLSATSGPPNNQRGTNSRLIDGDFCKSMQYANVVAIDESHA